jgi:hypothetical protein
VNDVIGYIESGILELYVLGDVTPEEKLQVEEMLSIHPAIKAEVIEIERAMELYARENSINPPENRHNKILNSLLTNFADDSTFAVKNPVVKGKVIAMPVSQVNSFYKYAFAASVILLLSCMAALYNTYSRLQESQGKLHETEPLVTLMGSQNELYRKKLGEVNGELVVFRDTSVKWLRLKGTAKIPSARMTVAWSPVQKKVIIDMTSMNLPENDQNHQYQLWALVGGKPVDLGVFDKIGNDTIEMKEMKSIASADAFAVTLEPRGGSAGPTMNEMMVIGKF